MTARLKKRQLAKKRKAHRRGLIAEKYAQVLLFFKGYRLIETRYRRPVGEIDLIVLRNKTLVAVEVKMRTDVEKALHAIGPIQQRRIRNTLLAYMAAHPEYSDYDLRFDVVLVTSFLKTPLHLQNVW